MISYINDYMSEVNGLTDDLYEALMDQEPDKAVEVIETLTRKLQELIPDLTDEL